ncbi:NAD(P)-dependent dehydrogenase (short-subunit alcohol dehydrogenase family) [Micromonospora sp. M71_S20]|uniref:SDR family NAD(P)-dependent oxidoreductase n=1 Tax=Micromonospora sp. M71_S20 TaxID=592872 RepID=UPI000EB55AF3|nr:SDR family oxidoreductase [Micromonospora sp. M71_S20]RLK09730.1 NAD(P)-dependent dehydrogenase (short-subunit alcohol dehydrogenase family) [Micromonospora sp. M71_S20]
MPGVLAGKAVVITGAGRGLGEAYARLAAAEGASVVVNDVDTAAAASVAGAIGALADDSDVATWTGAGRLIDNCRRAYGRVDGLVNNAGLFRLAGPREQDPEEFRRVLEVNLLGTAYCGLHAIRAMLEQGGAGSVVNVTSGSQSGTAALAAYGASKGGVASLTWCWAADLADTEVRVNAVSPNAHTRMADAFERHLGARARGQNVGKSPASNAPAVVHLLSDAAAGISGRIVRVDGDELSLVQPPRTAVAVRLPEWTVAAVAEAFAGDLRQQP